MARHLTPRGREQRHVIVRRPPTDYGATLVVVWLASPSKRRRRGGGTVSGYILHTLHVKFEPTAKDPLIQCYRPRSASEQRRRTLGRTLQSPFRSQT